MSLQLKPKLPLPDLSWDEPIFDKSAKGGEILCTISSKTHPRDTALASNGVLKADLGAGIDQDARGLQILVKKQMLRSQGFQVAWVAGYGPNRSSVKDALDLAH